MTIGDASRVMDYSIGEILFIIDRYICPLTNMLKMISVLDSMYTVATSKHDCVRS